MVIATATTTRTGVLPGIALFAVLVATTAAPASVKEITGTPGDDVLTGTPQADTIRGLAGFDTITPGKGDDRAFGGADADAFRWANSDGHDAIDGGPGPNFLDIDTGGRDLRLHIGAPGGGSGPAAGSGAQVITVRGLDQIDISMRSGGDHDLTVSSDRGIGLSIELGRGRHRVDASEVRGETFITAPFDIPGAVIRGSAGFLNVILAGEGDDDIRTGRGGSFIQGAGGDDTIRLGRGRDRVRYPFDAVGGHDTVHGFAADDRIELFCAQRRPASLDTNRDGRLDAKDGTVRVRGGSMTLDLSRALSQVAGTTTVRLVGRTGIGLGQVEEECFDLSPPPRGRAGGPPRAGG